VLVDLPCGDGVLKGEADSTIDRDLFIGGTAWMSAREYLSEFCCDRRGVELDST
jgi:hypothetical protein